MSTYWKLEAKFPGQIDEADHPWLMPGIICLTCERKWASVGASLPSVSLTGLAVGEKLRIPRAVEIDEWRSIARELRPHVPASEPIVPGLDLGPISGNIIKPFRLAFLPGSWGLIAEAAIKDEFEATMPEIPLVLSNLDDGQGGQYYELEIRSGGERLYTVRERCDVCGYDIVNFPQGLFALAEVPDASLFRLRHDPAAIFAHERVLPLLKRELGPSVEFLPATLAA